MLTALLLLAVVTLLAVVALLLRNGATQRVPQDPRLLALADTLPTQLARIEAVTSTRFDTLHAEIATIRRDATSDAQSHRNAINQSALNLREEVTKILTHLGGTITGHLTNFHTHSAETLGAHRTDTASAGETLRYAVKQDLDAINQRLVHFIAEANRNHGDSREALHSRLNELGTAQAAHQESLRFTVEKRLDHLTATNAERLEAMRATVDEKLQSTLHTRLTESFGQVTDQLTKVHSGLGEMSKLSEGVDGLSRIFTNVKSRGGFAEVQLGMLLEQMLAPSQFLRNARIKPRTNEVVEFAVRFPGHSGETLLPIDAKFPREDFERLESAYESGSPTEITSAGRAFEAAIRTEGKRICDKYIEQPVTTPYAIMFLPTEGLYAEVMRREGLQAELQSKCHVTIAGPSTLSAILSSFQMGFHMLAIQQKGDEVWKVLGQTRSEFGKFEKLMDSMEKQVGTVQNSLQSLGVRTRAINRTLRDVGELDATTNTTSALHLEESPTNFLPLLAASKADD